jgi:hypothetical protein
VISDDGRIHLFPWLGTARLDTLRLALRYAGLKVEQSRIHLSVGDATVSLVEDALAALTAKPPPAEALAFLADNLRLAKFDSFIPDQLLREAFIRDRLEIGSLAEAASRLLST